MKKTGILFLLLFVAGIVSAQRISTELEAHFKAIKKGKPGILTEERLAAYAQDKGSIPILAGYLKDKNEKVGKEAVFLLAKVGSRHTDEATRTQSIHFLLDACPMASSIRLSQIADHLQWYKKEDFDKLGKEKLMDFIKLKRPHVGQFILIAGFLRMRLPLDGLRFEFPNGSEEKQALDLARVRSGNRERLESMMKNIKKLPVDDEFVDRVAPLLIYTRQRAPMNYLFDQILSYKKNCTPADAETEGNIFCAYRLAEMIAPYIQDFPVELDETTGEFKTDDYEETLREVRLWIALNKNRYILKLSIY